MIKLNIRDKVEPRKYFDTYLIDIKSTPDGHNTNKLCLSFGNNASELDEMNEILFLLSVCDRVDYDKYIDIPTWGDSILVDFWIRNDENEYDAYESHKVYYYNKNGEKFNVGVELSENSKSKINEIVKTLT